MSDNIEVKAASTVPVATDVVTHSGDAGQNVQLMRPVLVTGAEGSKTVVDLPGDASNGLDVDVTRVVPGTGATHLGKAEDAGHTTGDTGVMVLGVRNDADADLSGTDLDYTPLAVDARGNQSVILRADQRKISVQSAGLTIATTAYIAGDQVATLFTLAGAARAAGKGGRITAVRLIDAADVIGGYDVIFFEESVTLAADNAAFSVSDADLLKVVDMVQVAGAFDLGGNRLATSQNISIPYTCNGSTNLYAALINRAGHTFFGAVGNLQLHVYVELN